MALFLSEAYDRHEGAQSSMDLTECALALLDLSNQQAELTEGIMTADYILEKRCQNLSEGETSDKLKDFARKVWAGIKAFAKTVWAKIKQIAGVIWRKLKEWSAKVYNAFAGKEVMVTKGNLILLEKLPPLVEKSIFIAGKGYSNPDQVTDALSDAKANNVEAGKVEAAAKAASGSVKVGKATFDTFAKNLEKLAEKLTKATEDQEKTVSTMENLADKLSDESKDDAKKLQEASTSMRGLISTLQSAAGDVTNLAQTLTTSFKEVPEKKK